MKVAKNITEESEEDKELKEELKILVDRILSKNDKLQQQALDMLKYLIRTSTTSMTSVPKPLKYLADYYKLIKEAHKTIKSSKVRKLCADIISVLAMSAISSDSVAREKRDCLNYCLIGSMNDVGDWGHEYVRQLETEIIHQWAECPEYIKELLPLVHMVVKFDATHHAEIQACDLVMEIDQLDILEKYITKDTYGRICLYLASCTNYVEDIEARRIQHFVLRQYITYEESVRALIIAIQLRDYQTVQKLFKTCNDSSIQNQMAYIIGKQLIYVELEDNFHNREELNGIISNNYLNNYFQMFARELNIMEPKLPEDIYKIWLEPATYHSSLHSTHIDSARQNLASSFVNAFINAGFGRDKLITVGDGNKWIYRNKDHGMISATASLGLIHLWDVDGGLTPIDKYLYTSDDNVKAGALMALGIVNCRVRNECDPALALLCEYVMHSSTALQIGSIFGLGLAYAGTQREDVLELLLPIITSTKSTPEILAVASIACGLIAVSSCDHKVTSCLLARLIDSKNTNLLSNTYIRFMLLGLGLCYLGRKEAIEASSAALEVFNDPFKSLSQTMLQMCAYAGSGDVLVVQELLHILNEHSEPSQSAVNQPENSGSNNKSDIKLDKSGKTKPKKKEKGCKNEFCEVQAIAALGVALVSLGEETGNEMCTRIFGQMVRYGDACMRKTVPLAIALCSISSPQNTLIDVLNKYSHDTDDEVSCNAIFGMGLIGAGSNNARLATMLRQLAIYHSRNSGQMFMIRLAQGLVHLGKGTLSLSPLHSDKQLFCTTALAGLLVTVVALVDSPNIISGKAHYLLYSLVTAMKPRWLITLDENLEHISIPVRIGQAVDIVAKAGIPKTIAGIHTHNTPVLLAIGERAELATDQYEAMSSIMEGVVILRKKSETE